MINRIGLVAKREFTVTVMSKGFLIGLLIMPALALLFFTVVPLIMGGNSPQIHGDVAVIDGTGQVMDELKAALTPEAITARAAAAAARNAGGLPPSQNPPHLNLVERPRDASLDQEKSWLTVGTREEPHIGVIVIHPDAVTRDVSKPGFGAYDLYVANGVNEATEAAIYGGVRQALVTLRLRAKGLEVPDIESTMTVPRPNAVVVSAGKQAERRGFSRALPFICGLLLFMGVITGGQTLMASTIEEKSSRVVEVLLAAVSPLDLMWGKLLGQLGVGLVVMAVYIGLGVLGLSQFRMLSLLDPRLVVFLFAFYLVTYLMFGSLMLSVGAAVSQIADAQSLMGPLMLLLLAPYVLTPIIGQAPNSTFSVVVSFIPPVNTFAMMARLASDTPPPLWQTLLTLVVGLGGAALCVWFAARIFRISLLMHGKPPNLATLIRWARMA